ncbi:sulfur transferase domain-containing protein [Halobacteriovorax sp. JY17]|uniref:tyrosine-protein phosphatase n=1 Tax=Halobacteriovorax sp. JY17 TaxID=2014617 RepID=UPI000C67F38D|nr:sulfur transferase domain-containing protein [Halobacteriovorax sp. JY17]PIK16420.1 MAG: hypothetical protein CES88_06680 [Halobacteriovorax sp. JY17]
MRRIILLIIGVFVLNACAHKKGKSESDIRIGENLQSNRYGTIYFSKQPDDKDWAKLKEQGFETIINLREPSEHDEKNERKLIVKSGMTYVNIPFPKKMKLDNNYVSKVTKEVMKNKDKGKILIHCSSGNRVGIWVGAHFYKDHGFSKKESINTAKAHGLNKPEAINKLKKYFENN